MSDDGVKAVALPQVVAFKGGKLAAKVDKVQPALGGRRPNGRQFLALADDFLLFNRRVR